MVYTSLFVGVNNFCLLLMVHYRATVFDSASRLFWGGTALCVGIRHIIGFTYACVIYTYIIYLYVIIIKTIKV